MASRPSGGLVKDSRVVALVQQVIAKGRTKDPVDQIVAQLAARAVGEQDRIFHIGPSSSVPALLGAPWQPDPDLSKPHSASCLAAPTVIACDCANLDICGSGARRLRLPVIY